MFSRQLICAVFILNELSFVKHKYGPQAGLGRASLNKLGVASNMSVNRALSRLKSSYYVSYSTLTKLYTLSVDITNLSMLDLVKLFHGSPVIGEEYDPALVYGDNYLPLKEHGLEIFVKADEKLKCVIETELLEMKILSFSNYTFSSGN